MSQSHFENKDALAHVVQKRIDGIVSLSESHGTEVPGHISAGADSARETALFLLVIWLLLASIASLYTLPLLIASACGIFAWKSARSAFLGWSRLERLHRLIEQEKYEIEHHRDQEREELVALYSAKGFSGSLLDQVVDVLMANSDRLLKVMLEEEMGLTLQAYEHPIKQCLGAAVGSLCAGVLGLLLFWLWPNYGMIVSAGCVVVSATWISAVYEKNQLISAIVWNLSYGALTFGVVYFVLAMVLG